MSARDRTRSHGRGNGRPQLVLVRGGLDQLLSSTKGCSDGNAALASDLDWEKFCHRIGWQESDDSLPDDYADRLAELIVAVPEFENNIRGLAVERENNAANAAWVSAEHAAVEAMTAAPARSEINRAMVRGACFAIAGVAAVALVSLAGASLWSPGRSAVDVAAAPERETSPPAAVGPPRELAAPIESGRSPEAPTAVPSPTPAPELCPEPPGSRVAYRSNARRARGRPMPAGAPVLSQMGLPSPALEAESAVDAEAVVSPSATTLAAFNPQLKHEIDGAWSRPESPATESALAWSTPVTKRDRAATPNWAVSPASSRWYGVSLSPAFEPVEAMPSGMGVMAQVDVAKALAL